MATHTTTRSPRRVVVVTAIALSLSALAGCLTHEQNVVLRWLNDDRVEYGLRPLSPQEDAQRKAQAWAEKLARERALYHSNLSSGIRVRWCELGENVGYGPRVGTIQNAYMASPGHRANILSTKWNGVGVGYAKNGDTTWTVQFFIKTC